jgi:hypothetical protein
MNKVSVLKELQSHDSFDQSDLVGEKDPRDVRSDGSFTGMEYLEIARNHARFIRGTG